MKDIIVLLYWTKLGIIGLKLQELYSIIILMKFKTQKSVTDKITSINLNSMGFNSLFLLCSTFGLLFIHGYIIATLLIFCAFTVLMCKNGINVYIWAAPKSTGIRHDSKMTTMQGKQLDILSTCKSAPNCWGLISPTRRYPNLFFPTCTLQREKGVISFHVQKILLLFSI